MKNRARAYRSHPGGFRVIGNQLTAIGSSSLYTTIDDLAKWILNFETKKVGGEAAGLMHQRGVLNNGKKISYAFGVSVTTYRGLPIVQHGGSWAGFRTQLVRFPKQRFAVVVLFNLAGVNPGGRARQIADVYLGDKLSKPGKARRGGARAKPANAVKGGRLEDYLGKYYSDELDTSYTVVLHKKRLVVEHRRNPDVNLRADPGRKDRFRGSQWWMRQVQFVRDDDTSVTEMLVSNGRALNLRFVRKSK